eukprot:6200410-Pleurochrysis_carterae.AAC.1
MPRSKTKHISLFVLPPGRVSFTDGGGHTEASTGEANAFGEDASPLPWLAAFEAARAKRKTEAESRACLDSLCAIRRRYGESSERLIAMLLTFDSLFNFRKVMRLRFDAASAGERAERALHFARTRALHLCLLHCCCTVQMDRVFYEQFERVSLGQHHSKYPHAVQYKAVAQMLEIGDLWPFSLSALESYHAEVGRVADRTGCKRISADKAGECTLSSHPAGVGKVRKEGPARLTHTHATTTM